jgi:hypothetical protein
MTLVHEVLGHKLHKMSGLLHVLQFCSEELKGIEEGIPSSHHIYLNKMSHEVARLKETLEGFKGV